MIKQKRFLSRPLEALTWLAAILCVAGVVHLSTILVMPRIAPDTSFARIAALGPPNKLVLLPAVEPGREILPFEDPATATAACAYDLARGPVRLRGQLAPDALVLLSFHGRYGQTFYAMTDRSALRGRVDVVIATRDQLDDIEANDAEDELPQELRLESPARQGFILLRALAERPSLMGEARDRLSSLTCEG
ncbi:MAG: hypothetical protein JWO64_2516 [Hyphomicrobiales bacterium]|nr:hypothetical protein [Hyphomicrobiales bacterium]